jgi:SAM-dependent methyltransferase
VLEIGVGTGQMALPVHAAGVKVVGVDLSAAMLQQLTRKAGGRAPFPLARGDATRLPFGDASFGAAYLRWVLHLIPSWRRALGELVRVVEPGGVIVVQLGSGSPGREGEIRRRCCDLVGVPADPPGLDWGDTSNLDVAMAALGCDLRLLGPLRNETTERVSEFLNEIEQGVYSWTWPIDEGSRREAVAAIRPWAEHRWGPLDREIAVVYETYWRVYDVA